MESFNHFLNNLSQYFSIILTHYFTISNFNAFRIFYSFKIHILHYLYKISIISRTLNPDSQETNRSAMQNV